MQEFSLDPSELEQIHDMICPEDDDDSPEIYPNDLPSPDRIRQSVIEAYRNRR